MKGFVQEKRKCGRCDGLGFETYEAKVKYLEEQKKMFSCFDCSVFPKDEYMVKNSTWREAGGAEGSTTTRGDNQGILCIACLERRLGRQLTADDFDFSLPINRMIAFGFRMGFHSRPTP